MHNPARRQNGRRRHGFAPAALLLLLGFWSAPALAQLPPPPERDPVATSKAITGLMAEQNFAKAAEMAGDLMGEPGSREKMQGIFKALEGFGKSQYSDRIYSRAFGYTTYDIIDKINFDGAVLFVRYTYHVERGRWILLNFTYKSENNLPLPAEWKHIYP